MLRGSITAAFQLRDKILQYQPNWLSVKETGQGEVQDGLGEYLALVDTKTGVSHGGDDDINIHLEKIVEKAKQDFEIEGVKYDSDSEEDFLRKK
jgi:hypothetical protein